MNNYKSVPVDGPLLVRCRANGPGKKNDAKHIFLEAIVAR